MANKKMFKKKINVNKGIKEIKKFGDEMIGRLRVLKNRYDQLDDKTKKGILAGIAGVAAVVAGISAVKKISKKK